MQEDGGVRMTERRLPRRRDPRRRHRARTGGRGADGAVRGCRRVRLPPRGDRGFRRGGRLPARRRADDSGGDRDRAPRAGHTEGTGRPAGVRLPDGTEAGLLGGVLRNGLDLYANVRPIAAAARDRVSRCASSRAASTTRSCGRTPRASTSPAARGRQRLRDDRHAARDPGRLRADRPVACELARRRPGAPGGRREAGDLVDKANVLPACTSSGRSSWRSRPGYPDIDAECLYVDAAAQALVMRPSIST